MNLDFDSIIFISFLVLNLIVGLFYSRGVKNAKEYAIGDRNFSTIALTITIIATCVGGGFFTPALVESYRQGLYFIIPALGEPLALIITGYFLIPKMSNFCGNLSIADIMGKIYGRNVKLVTAIAGVLYSVGVVALQFKIAALMIKLFYNISEFNAILLSGSIVVFYSSLGGIKAVTFTDVLQFCTFSIIIPLICFSIWKAAFNDSDLIFNTINNNPIFDFRDVLSINNSRFISSVSLFLFFIIPAGDPAYIQRIGAAKNILQARKSFIAAGVIIIIILLITCYTGVLLYGIDQNIKPDDLLIYLINNYTYPGLKGLAAISIMAIIMSTADSYINSATVMIENDIIKTIFPSHIKKEIFYIRCISFSIGILAGTLSYEAGSIFQLGITTLSFYMPIVSVPLLVSILGFKITEKITLAGMVSGGLGTLLWLRYGYEGSNEIIPGMIANAITLSFCHHIFDKKKSNSTIFTEQFLLNKIKDTKLRWHRLLSENFYDNKARYLSIGFFAIISTVSQSYLVKSLTDVRLALFHVIFVSSLIFSTILIILMVYNYPKLKEMRNFFKIFSVTYLLIFTPSVTCFISNFEQFSLIIFSLSILVLLYTVKWQFALVSLVVTELLAFKFFTYFIDQNFFWSISSSSFYKVICITFIVIGITVAFLKPKQDEQEIAEEIAEHLSHELEYRNREIVNLSNLKQVFLRNLQHETNTPVTGIYSMSQALDDCYDKLSDKERKKAINTIMTSSERLISYVNNLIDFSKIMNASYKLQITKVNLSRLLEECLRKCIKLYISKDLEEDRDIKMNISKNLIAFCDEYYIRRSYENLIINSLQYCKKGRINISLIKEVDYIKLIITDSGIGIPKGEHSKIFEPFVVSSNTLTPAGGRGMGLTLVKAIAEIHGGKVEALSMEKGSKFTFVIPS